VDRESTRHLTERFRGPLFVVGMPRSGTKLLRDLLNRHPRITIPEVESHFIPSLLRLYGESGPLSDHDLGQVYDTIRASSFFWHMRQRGRDFVRSDFLAGNRGRGIRDVILDILEHYGKGDDSAGVDAIIGDKTPLYLGEIDLLRNAFSRARFIHIIRDPRDVCLSAKKVWGHHVYRTAQRWQELVSQGRNCGREYDDDYIEVKFEDLLTDTESVMRDLCAFLGCEYDSRMTALSRSNENRGDARGATEVVSSNMKKYREEMSAGEVRRVEEIAYEQLTECGYRPTRATQWRPLSEWSKQVLRMHDFVASLVFNVRARGLIRGVGYLGRQRGWPLGKVLFRNGGSPRER